jgi:ribonucleoside-diphosphate reductase alpha chain
MTVAIAPISRQIWDMKYRLRAPGGEPLDGTVEDSWRRIARALAAPEADAAAWEGRFYEALEGFRFLPAGRIVAGAGSDRKVTLFNCFVMGPVADDMAGIFEALKDAALTMQQGGGIGIDFSTLRPRGAAVHGVGADASGPISFMRVWDAMCRTIMSAGHRRGAMMATLRCDHPDIEAFVDAKREAGELRMFNLSVLVTDAFMDAVQRDAPWDLAFGGTTWRTLPARELWRRIMRATYTYAEPGVVFIDRVNRLNPLYYCEEVHATNPCVTADTWVHTAAGPAQVADLVGRPFTAVVDGQGFASAKEGFFATGCKPVLRLVTTAGHALRLTADHPVLRVTRRTRWRQDTDWCPAGALRPGVEIRLSDQRTAADWPGAHSEDEGYLVGLLIGDGTLKTDKAVLSAWPGREAVHGGVERPGVLAVMERALAAARTLPHRADFAGWTPVAGRGEHRLALAAIRRLAIALGLRPGAKAVTPAMERSSAAFHRGLLRGLFDADGSVQGGQSKGVSIRLAQSDLGTLQAVQRMLLRLGIAARIYAERRPAGPRRLPDGRGGTRLYDCAADHELIVAGDNLRCFADQIGFADTDKAAALGRALKAYRRELNREPFTAVVAAVEPDGEAEVYDVRIPGRNAFDANGLVVHNCGEQPLPPYGACLLGSINLASLVRAPFTDEAALDLEAMDALVPVAVRMLDNAIDVSRYPLPQQAEEARAKRRIGLGVTGLADALIMCGARYGSARAVALTESWMARFQHAATLASAELAAEKGAFPLYDAKAYLAGEYVAGLPEALREAIATQGLRNGLVTSVAPTGTISLMADNVSSGIEPVYAFEHRRNVLMPDGTTQSTEVTDHAFRLYRESFGAEAALTDSFVDAQELTPADHLVMQATVQRYIDSSISKTINCPEAISFDDFESVYQRAWELGCKGCTTYRPNVITGAVLETEGERAGERAARAAQAELPLEPLAVRPGDAYDAGAVVYMTRPLDRPEELPGTTYKLRWPESEHALYVTINDIVKDGRRRPFEIFVNSKNLEHYAWTMALTRMISAVFRRGGDVSFVVDELKAVFDPRGGQWVGGHYVPSLLAAIGDVIERHMIEIGFLKPEAEAEAAGARAGPLHACPRCGRYAMIRQEDCDSCTACGFSNCD